MRTLMSIMKETPFKFYKVMIISTLLYGSEYWTLTIKLIEVNETIFLDTTQETAFMISKEATTYNENCQLQATGVIKQSRINLFERLYRMDNGSPNSYFVNTLITSQNSNLYLG